METPPEALRPIGALLARHPGVVAAWVIGSVARGEAGPTSDLDVAVLLRSPATDEDEAALRRVSLELERFSPSGRVDIVHLYDRVDDAIVYDIVTRHLGDLEELPGYYLDALHSPTGR